MNIQEKFFNFVRTNNIKKIKLLLNDNIVDPNSSDNFAIRFSSKNGYVSIFKLLINDNRVNLSHNAYENSILEASQNGYTEIVKLLLNSKFKPTSLNNLIIMLASRSGHFDVVKLLLEDKSIDPSFQSNNSIKLAFLNKHTDIVQLLWNEPIVKKSLKFDNIELYNKIISEEIRKKIIYF